MNPREDSTTKSAANSKAKNLSFPGHSSAATKPLRWNTHKRLRKRLRGHKNTRTRLQKKAMESGTRNYHLFSEKKALSPCLMYVLTSLVLLLRFCRQGKSGEKRQTCLCHSEVSVCPRSQSAVTDGQSRLVLQAGKEQNVSK